MYLIYIALEDMELNKRPYFRLQLIIFHNVLIGILIIKYLLVELPIYFFHYQILFHLQFLLVHLLLIHNNTNYPEGLKNIKQGATLEDISK